MRFRRLVVVFEELEQITSHIKLKEIFSQFLRKVPQSDLPFVVYLSLGRIDAKYRKTDLGMASKLIIRAIAKASGKSVDSISVLARKKGDLGLVAESVIRKQGNLTVKKVIDTLRQISTTSGSGSQEKKLNLLAGILVTADSKEAKFIIRIALGNLRLGVASATIIDSLALAFDKEKSVLQRSYEKNPDIGLIANLASTKKSVKLGVSVGIPIQMMLAQRVKSLDDLKKKIPGKITAEEKYDGERMQIHKKGNKIIIFSRRLENISNQYPDILQALKKSIKVKDCIIEGEVVAFKNGFLPFQTLMKRRRKYNVEKFLKEIPVKLFLFDCLYDGTSLINDSYPKRRSALKKIIRPNNIIHLAGQITSNNLDKIKSFFSKCIKNKLEGIIAKSNAEDSIYQAGTRGWFWIKWKEDYTKGKDTFDLVVVGGFAGKGKRAGSFGALLCAVYNKKNKKFETFTKVGSGFTDNVLKQLPKLFKKIKKPDNVFIKGIKPDFYFKPIIVIEVLGAEVTKSPSHSSGFALRFPRFLRFRDDKGPRQSTAKDEISR